MKPESERDYPGVWKVRFYDRLSRARLPMLPDSERFDNLHMAGQLLSYLGGDDNFMLMKSQYETIAKEFRTKGYDI